MSSVVYDLTVTQGINVVHTVMGAENGTEITGILDPGSYYNISVSARTVNGSCGGEPTTIECVTSPSIPPPSKFNLLAIVLLLIKYHTCTLL